MDTSWPGSKEIPGWPPLNTLMSLISLLRRSRSIRLVSPLNAPMSVIEFTSRRSLVRLVSPLSGLMSVISLSQRVTAMLVELRGHIEAGNVLLTTLSGGILVLDVFILFEGLRLLVREPRPAALTR